MKFLQNVLAVIIGLFMFFMLMFFGLLIFSAILGGDSSQVAVKKNSVIEFDLGKVSNDYAGKFQDPLVTLFTGSENVGLTDVISAIGAAKDDSKIKGISILNSSTMLGLAQSKAVRDALVDFKKSGKFVLAYSNGYSQLDYYLNSAADSIYLNPNGGLDFKGLSAEVLYFKDFQEKSGVKMEVIRHGKYKSAVEPFLANAMSEENREQLSELLGSIWDAVVADISESRKLPVATLNELANNLSVRLPEQALAHKMVDVVAYEDVYHDEIKKRLSVKEDEDYNTVDLLDYTRNHVNTPGKFGDDKIAVIYAQGAIMGGEGNVTVIGEKSMGRALKDAREDDKIKAVVLRVDSPGGSALTSDLIWREIELTKKVKPVVVSMGNYAASGGYYIACNADEIFAERGTITGSIGVFGQIPNVSELSKRWGINSQIVETHENSFDYSVFAPMEDGFKGTLTEEIERIYDTFITKVAAGRNMSREAVHEIAQGRVWTGEQALKLGLVDKIGGLDAAIAAAAKRANIKDYGTKNFPEYDIPFHEMIGAFPFAKMKQSVIEQEIGVENYEMLVQLREMSARKGVQTAMPYSLRIR